MTAPVLAVGDGALGFWAAVREVCLGLGVQWSGMDSRTRLRIALVDDAQRHPGRVAPQRPGQDRPGRVSSRAPAPGRSPLVAVGHGTDRGERRVSSRYVDVDAAIARVVAESGYPERQGWAEYYLKPPPATPAS
jgi:hypothetical protein